MAQIFGGKTYRIPDPELGSQVRGSAAPC